MTPPGVIFVLNLIRTPRIKMMPLDGVDFLTVLALIPFVALIFAIRIISLKGWRLECVFWGGLLAVTGFTAYGHVMVWWPIYFGGHMPSTSAVTFLFIPFYALVPLALGLFVGHVISLLGVLMLRIGN